MMSSNYDMAKIKKLLIDSKVLTPSLVKNKLGNCPNEILCRKLKRDKNNSSSNIYLNNNGSQLKKVKLGKKRNKNQLSLMKPSEIPLSEMLKCNTVWNNNHFNGFSANRLQVQQSILDLQDFETNSPVGNDKIVSKKKERNFQYWNKLVKKRGQLNNDTSVCKCNINNSKSINSLSSSMSAHNKVFVDNKEEMMNKCIAKLVKDMSPKTILTKTLKLYYPNENVVCRKSAQQRNSSSYLMEDIFRLVKVFVNGTSNNRNDDHVSEPYQKLKQQIFPVLCSDHNLHKISFRANLTNLPISCFNACPDSFFQHVYTPLNQIAVITLVSPVLLFEYSKLVFNELNENFFFNETLENVFKMRISPLRTGMELIRIEEAPFSKMKSCYFINEGLKFSSINLQRATSRKLFYTPDRKFYLENSECQTATDMLSLSSEDLSKI